MVQLERGVGQGDYKVRREGLICAHEMEAKATFCVLEKIIYIWSLIMIHLFGGMFWYDLK